MGEHRQGKTVLANIVKLPALTVAGDAFWLWLHDSIIVPLCGQLRRTPFSYRIIQAL